MAQSTVLEGEVAKFDALAAEWWDPRGPMAPLHAMNPLRTRWVAERIGAAEGRDPNALASLTILDVGCGAGLAAEALARRGAAVTGLDMAPEALSVARAHAAQSGLSIDYRQGRPEDLSGQFDAVTALEVVEHVADRDTFLASLARSVRPGGMVFLSTLNRTARSFLFAKLGAEYLLRLLPRGTHDWKMFVTPAELGAGLRRAGLRVTDVAGMVPEPLTGGWRESRDTAVNYIMAARKD
ncbi:bifunctional 2-polyprenyl-6-hydroxyphenol methylase/3-demethylubiquinol 3-O-methyltransferase UbiG [Roseomonas xinghualingensis]|uniref:bifunctional 2-polyprenyl-6-hydroxyphenol methylase/3-demethylubiquinol 3-O-methyltransferase UbiG n=1 Tax=Roseomonas xinghualingensis TaxID=2986475 RepID=UPI0021F22187|nr:bifunctional 2-polyprenyl-6-hydroxyphenol methylase/3-demethylubiquinol 3-O-methyltransferase UbiG [Roseomonas sp. SXEYE001]MCV4209480.1 bifunctional 2-polyprenyl-6-hydroxyphenol methylase/3-demethylubiquinol 3-O-methyltransferase UbiG [Roseomonas sp. SXEYE001]